MDSHKSPTSTSPPKWQWSSLSHPSSLASSNAQIPAPVPPETLNSDTAIKPIPAPAYIDMTSVKAEREATDISFQQPTSATSTPTTALTSPNNMSQLGPPPPYSATSVPTPRGGQFAQISAQAPRRDSREGLAHEPPRLSLPSISEALKLAPLYGQQSSQQGQSVPPPPSFSHAGLPDPVRSLSSGSPTIPRSHTESHHPSSLSSYSSQQSPHNSKPPDPIDRYYTNFTAESPRQSFFQPHALKPSSPTEPHRGSSIPQQRHSPTSAHSRFYPQSSVPPQSHVPHPQPQSQPHPAPSQGPTHSGSRPAYPHGAGYSFPPPATSGLNYQESLALGATQQQNAWGLDAEMDKVEEQRRQATLQAKRNSYGANGYGVTVKRHLDDFDLENSLNEIAERTHHVLEFSRAYGLEAHKYPRSTLPVNQLPSTERVADMINQSMAITEALSRLKTTVEGMNVAAAAAEEQARQQRQGALNKSDIYYGAEGQGHPGYGMQANGQDKDLKGDMPPGGGFASGDSKKRRGRNAPPGRCHSCNRAETPEWRRGPDGARTLCNACGLHYAKLTRKMGAKAAQPGGSNLRPKDGDDTTS